MNKTVIFMGTPQIAVPSLQALIEYRFNVPLVLSQPDKPKGRGNHLQPTPVKECAQAHGIEVFQPEKLKNNFEAINLLTALKPDFFAVVAYGRILPAEILSIPSLAPVNVHFSLLPLYRGAAPVNWAVLNGDESTGVSTMKMDTGMDTGDILLMETTPILKKSSVDLAEELAVKGAGLLVKTLNNYNEIIPRPQDHARHSLAPMMKKEDGCINWTHSAAYIERMTRAFAPWPGAYTTLNGKNFKIYAADVDTEAKGPGGQIYQVDKDTFRVYTSDGGLIIKELQLEGKRRMKAADFLAGFKLQEGNFLG